jgi:uncharacterized protein (DUF488 family)
MIVDVRSMPRSRANSQFNIDALPDPLGGRQIGYRHIAALGGLRARRRRVGDSPNTFWQNKSFRNYADYAMTPSFKAGLAELIELGRRRTCAIMCAEVLWWRCHRRIIADYLLADGAAVFHILGPRSVMRAFLTPGVAKFPEGLIYRERGTEGRGVPPSPSHGGQCCQIRRSPPARFIREAGYRRSQPDRDRLGE